MRSLLFYIIYIIGIDIRLLRIQIYLSDAERTTDL